ncbi:MAG TPA: Lrp/AsnC family transcriptional regulator [Nitrososphaera sp.]|jgi:Lrp/AsnC family transcriptional regulator for asnA, asnC and gidA
MSSPTDLIDELNLRIIDLLSRDASRPFVEIAKELEISDATVHMRVRRLMASGIIRKFTISTDDRLLGYSQVAFMGINVKDDFIEEVTSALSKFDEVLEVHEMYGRFDLLLKLRAKSMEEMRNTIANGIRKIPQISGAELMPALKTVKEEHNIQLSADIEAAVQAATS